MVMRNSTFSESKKFFLVSLDLNKLRKDIDNLPDEAEPLTLVLLKGATIIEKYKNFYIRSWRDGGITRYDTAYEIS